MDETYIQQAVQTLSTPQSQSAPSRLLEGALLFPQRVANVYANLASIVPGLGELRGDAPQVEKAAPEGFAQGGAELLAQLAPLFAGAGSVTKLARNALPASASKGVANAVGTAAEFATYGAQHSPELAGEQGLEGLAAGPLRSLPLAQRVLPVLALMYGSKIGVDAIMGDEDVIGGMSAGDLNAATLATLLLGRGTPKLAPVAKTIPVDEVIAPPRLGYGSRAEIHYGWHVGEGPQPFVTNTATARTSSIPSEPAPAPLLLGDRTSPIAPRQIPEAIPFPNALRRELEGVEEVIPKTKELRQLEKKLTPYEAPAPVQLDPSGLQLVLPPTPVPVAKATRRPSQFIRAVNKQMRAREALQAKIAAATPELLHAETVAAKIPKKSVFETYATETSTGGKALPHVLPPVAGGIVGGTIGDSPEERVTNALLGITLGFTPTAVPKIMRKLDDAAGLLPHAREVGGFIHGRQIKAAALKDSQGKLYLGPSHGMAAEQMPKTEKIADYGFVDDIGNFYPKEYVTKHGTMKSGESYTEGLPLLHSLQNELKTIPGLKFTPSATEASTIKIVDSVTGKSYTIKDEFAKVRFKSPSAGSPLELRISEDSPVNTIRQTIEADRAAIPKGVAPKKGAASKLQDQIAGKSSEGGFIIPQLNRALAGGVIGGGIGAIMNDENPGVGFGVGAFTLALTAGLGPDAIQFARQLSKLRLPSKSVTSPKKAVGEILRAKVEDLGRMGANPAAETPGAARFVRALEKWFRVGMPEELKVALSQAKGTVAVAFDSVERAFRNVGWRYSPTEDMLNQAAKYLDNATPEAEAAFKAGLKTPEEKAFGEFIIASRNAVDGLSDIFAKAIKDPKYSAIIQKNKGRYLSRVFKLYNDPAYRPTEQQIAAVAKSDQAKSIFPDMTEAEIGQWVRNYIQEVKMSNKVWLRATTPTSQKIERSIYEMRKPLSKEFREMLGEITNPVERIYHTLERLGPSVTASKYFELVRELKIKDVPQYFESIEAQGAFIRNLQSKLTSAISPSERSAIEAQIREVESYMPISNQVQFGRLRSGMVSRYVWDSLATYENVANPISGAMGTWYANLNRTFKLMNTVYSPMGMVRQFISAPAFLAIGRGAQGISEAWEALRTGNVKELLENGIITADFIRGELRSSISKFYKSGLDLPTIAGFDMEALVRGYKRGIHQNLVELYRQPDMFVRAATYFAAKKRFAEQLGKAIDDPEIIRKATAWTDRYTMNYDNIAPAVLYARNIPPFNMFISYTAEMIRIIKNLGEDVIQNKDPYAAAMLGVLLAAPTTMQKLAEASLSERDRKEWQALKGHLPAYARDRLMVPLERKKNGDFKYIDMTEIMPAGNFITTAAAIFRGDAESFAAVNPIASFTNSPFVNMMTEQIVGKDLRTFEEVSSITDPKRIAMIANDLVPPFFPKLGYEAQRAEQAFSRNREGGRGIVNERTGRGLTPMEYLQQYVTGSRMGTIRPSLVAKRAIAEARRPLYEAERYLREVEASNAPEDVKEKVRSNFIETSAQILARVESIAGELRLSQPEVQ